MLKVNKMKLSKEELIKRSKPRPEIRPRSTVFEDKTKYKRSREKQSFRIEHGY